MEENVRINNNIIMEDRKKLTLTGIKDVIAFDDETITLASSLGRIVIKGEALRIVSFDNKSGDLSAEGKFSAIVYTAEERSEGFFSKLFR